jgi:hypothetical protein
MHTCCCRLGLYGGFLNGRCRSGVFSKETRVVKGVLFVAKSCFGVSAVAQHQLFPCQHKETNQWLQLYIVKNLNDETASTILCG